MPNGLKYRIVRQGQADEPVNFELVVNAGTYDEDPDQIGVAHLVEHVVAIHDTKDFPGIRSFFERNGLKLGTNYGASTGSRETIYWIKSPASNQAFYPQSYELLRGWAADSKLSAADIDTERAPVVNELAQGRSNKNFLAQRELRFRITENPCVAREFFSKHDEVIRTVPADVVRRFYRDWYRPDNQTLTITGPVDLDDAEGRIRAVFGSLSTSSSVRSREQRLRCVPRLDQANRAIVVGFPEVPQITLYMFLQRPTEAGVDEHRRLIESILSKAMWDRAQSRQKRYLTPYRTLGLFTDNDPTARAEGVSLAGATAELRNAGDVKLALEDLVSILRSLSSFGLTDKEVDEALSAKKSEIAADAANERDASDSLESQQHTQRLKLLASITKNDLNAALTSLIDLSHNVVVGLTASEEQLRALPSEADLIRIFDTARAAAIPSPDTDRVAPEALMSRAEIHALSQKEAKEVRTDDPSGVTSIVLSNGIRILFRPEITSDGAPAPIRVSAYRNGGIWEYGEKQRASAGIAFGAALNGGAGRWDKFSFQDFLQPRGIFLGGAIGRSSARIDAGAPASEFEHLLQALHLILTKPRWSKDAFRDWKNIQDDESKRYTKAEPEMNAVLIDHMWRGGVDTSGHCFTPQSDMQEAREIFADRFEKAGDFTFVVTGGVDLEIALPLLSRYIGTLAPASSRKDPVRPSPQLGSYERMLFNKGAGPHGDVLIYITHTLPTNPAERLTLEVIAEVLNARIYDRIREKEGGSYGPSAGLALSGEDFGRAGEPFSLMISFDWAPGRLEALKAAALEEVDRLREQGVDEDTLKRAVAQVIQRPGSTIPVTWHQYLEDRRWGTKFDFDPAERVKILNVLTVEQVNVAAARYLNMDHALEIVRVPAS